MSADVPKTTGVFLSFGGGDIEPGADTGAGAVPVGAVVAVVAARAGGGSEGARWVTTEGDVGAAIVVWTLVMTVVVTTCGVCGRWYGRCDEGRRIPLLPISDEFRHKPSFQRRAQTLYLNH
jgi:hypothetical protein